MSHKYMPGRPGHLKSCGRIMIKAESIEKDVAEQVLARVLSPANVALMTGTAEGKESVDQGVGEFREAEQRLRQLGVDYAVARMGGSSSSPREIDSVNASRACPARSANQPSTSPPRPPMGSHRGGAMPGSAGDKLSFGNSLTASTSARIRADAVTTTQVESSVTWR